MTGGDVTGTVLELDVGAVAHGGFCVARHEGRAVFVRHGLPGERVRALVTEGAAEDRYWRADAVQVLRPSSDRVPAPCPHAGPGRCGGCDWQHVRPAAQRGLKADVLADALSRFAGLTTAVEVEELPGVDGAEPGLGWRTRTRLAVGADGRPGLRRHRSRAVEPIEDCLLAHPDADVAGLLARNRPGVDEVGVTVSGTGQRTVWTRTGPDVGSDDATGRSGGRRGRAPVPPAQVVEGPGTVRERAAGRVWRVSADGFWQVHPAAADTLAAAALDALDPRPGETAMDLYSGVGLFSAGLAGAVGPQGRVVAVESGGAAVRDARRNLHDLPRVELVVDRVDRFLRTWRDPVDVVLLDPPRTGARGPVVRALAGLRPRRVVYVACDPVALARDVASFAEAGYRLVGLRAFDLFPMTHHLEAVATLEPDPPTA